MTQAKPAATPAAAAAPAAAPTPAPDAPKAPAPDAKKTSKPKKVQNSWDKIKVKNVGKRCINLTHGSIEKDKTGIATAAEFSCLADYLEKV